MPVHSRPQSLRRRPLAALLSLALATQLPLLPAAMAADNQQAEDTNKRYDIASGALGRTLASFAASAGIALSFDPALTDGRSNPAVNGRYSAREVLNRLLSGSGLELVPRSDGSYTLRQQETPPAAHKAGEAATLPEVAVTSKAEVETAYGPLASYAAKRTATATKTDTPILEVPQSISVIGREEMDARGVQDMMDIVALTPGISVNTYGPDNRGWEYINLRGFASNTSSFRDGLPQSQFEILYRVTEPYSLERAEVLRGPSSVMFGQGDAGGVINRVSKRPTGERLREVEVQYGSFQRKQVGFDFGDKVAGSDQLSYRVVGLGMEANDQDKYPDGRRIGRSRLFLAPSLRWQPGENTSLTLLSEFIRNDSDEDPYYAILGNGKLSRVKMGDHAFSSFKQDQDSVGYLFEHAFNERWTVRQNARYSDVSLQRKVLWVDSLQPDGHTYSRYTRSWDDRMTQASLDTQLQGKLSTGSLAHTVLFGMDGNKVNGDVKRFSGLGPDLDLLAPVYGQDIADPQTPFRNFSQDMYQVGVYAQDQIKLQRWILTIGGRQDHVRTETDDRLNASKRAQSDDKFSSRVGLTYLVGNGWAPYASYTESFLPNNGVDANNDPFQPSRGKQVEVGLKFQPEGSRSLFTAALFDLRKTNVVTFDNNTFESRQIGKQRSRGLELEAKTELLPGLNLAASYTLMDLKVLQSADTTEVGKIPATIPEKTAAVWLDYMAGNGFGAGAGLNYVGRRQNDEANTSSEASYMLANAMLRYDHGDWRLTVNASNLLNKDYNTICYHGECYLGRERTVTAVLRYRF